MDHYYSETQVQKSKDNLRILNAIVSEFTPEYLKKVYQDIEILVQLMFYTTTGTQLLKSPQELINLALQSLFTDDNAFKEGSEVVKTARYTFVAIVYYVLRKHGVYNKSVNLGVEEEREYNRLSEILANRKVEEANCLVTHEQVQKSPILHNLFSSYAKFGTLRPLLKSLNIILSEEELQYFDRSVRYYLSEGPNKGFPMLLRRIIFASLNQSAEYESHGNISNHFKKILQLKLSYKHSLYDKHNKICQFIRILLMKEIEISLESGWKSYQITSYLKFRNGYEPKEALKMINNGVSLNTLISEVEFFSILEKINQVPYSLRNIFQAMTNGANASDVLDESPTAAKVGVGFLVAIALNPFGDLETLLKFDLDIYLAQIKTLLYP